MLEKKIETDTHILLKLQTEIQIWIKLDKRDQSITVAQRILTESPQEKEIINIIAPQLFNTPLTCKEEFYNTLFEKEREKK